MSTKPRHLLRLEYEKAAEAYLKSLPPEHFMEAEPQATQREITLASLAVVRGRRTDFHLFNEMLVQYPFGPAEDIHQVVPDNMVVVHPEPLKVKGSYDVPLQPCKPFWTLEYVSKNSERKDYNESLQKYEQELGVPYALFFYPDIEELTLYHLSRGRYVSVKPNKAGRYPIRQLELELGMLDGWVRFWYQGELLPLTAELDLQVREERQLRQEAERRADEAACRADEATQRADEEQRLRVVAEQELAELKAQLEQLRGRRKNG